MFGLMIQTPEPIIWITGLKFDRPGNYGVCVVTTKPEARTFYAGGGGPANSLQELATGRAFLVVKSTDQISWTVTVDPATHAVTVTPDGGTAISLPSTTLAAMAAQVTNAVDARTAYNVLADQVRDSVSDASLFQQFARNTCDAAVMELWHRHSPILQAGGRDLLTRIRATT